MEAILDRGKEEVMLHRWGGGGRRRRYVSGEGGGERRPRYIGGGEK